MAIKVEILSAPGCSKCARAKEALKSVVNDLGQDRVAWREVDILEEMDYAVELGLMSSGGIAIDGTLVFPRLPSAEKLREELARRVKGESR
ncbi:MAG TPA: thioredoxin family protein [Burkholderiales bacterium]|nr:thioredoxin family protein [Burkholderiales bacterium]